MKIIYYDMLYRNHTCGNLHALHVAILSISMKPGIPDREIMHPRESFEMRRTYKVNVEVIPKGTKRITIFFIA